MDADALTELTIKNLKPRTAAYEVFDGKVAGFGIRVFPSGTRSFVVFYRHEGRLRRLTLGRYPVLSLAEARKLAQRALNKSAHGDDPQSEKTDARNVMAFDQTAQKFIATHCQRFNRPSTARETERVLNAHFVSRWGGRDVREIMRADIVAVLDQIFVSGAPSAANHALSAIRKFFSWAVDRGLVETHPCLGLKKPSPHRSRDHVLSDDDLAAVWNAARAIGYPYGTIIQLLILTAQRRGEVVDMRWPEIDFEHALWTIPAARTKSNRTQVLPLSKATLAILAQLPKLEDDRVFPAQREGENAFSGFSRAKARLDEISLTSGWVVHDLRRTAATGMAKLSVAPHVVERILNHTSGVLGGVAGVYNRFGYMPEMRSALEKWARRVSKLPEASI